MTMTMTMMKTTTIYQLYWCNFIAICTTCRKKHSERLLGLGWHSSTKGSVNQEAADSERFVGYFIVSKIPHHARCLFACQVRNWDKDCVGGCRFNFLWDNTVTPLFLCESLSLPTRSFEENMSNNVRSILSIRLFYLIGRPKLMQEQP